MRLNLRLVKASQFFQQFKLDVRHKSEKENIITNTLSRLVNINVGLTNPGYLELDALFTYNATFVKIYSTLILRILAGYKADAYWSYLQRQIQVNEELNLNKTLLPFIISSVPILDTDLYMNLYPEDAPEGPFPHCLEAFDMPQ